MAAPTVTAYIQATPPPVRGILEALRALLATAHPELTLAMKWGAPVYITPAGKPVLYLYGGHDHANLGFLHRASLPDPQRLLRGRGKEGRHVRLVAVAEVDIPAIHALIRQALAAAAAEAAPVTAPATPHAASV